MQRIALVNRIIHELVDEMFPAKGRSMLMRENI